jgi:hypothetical protein
VKHILAMAFAVLSCFSSALAHIGETPDQIKARYGEPTFTLGTDEAPSPADFAYLYVVTGQHVSVAFYFEEGTCGEIRIIRSGDSNPFSFEDLTANFQEYAGVQRGTGVEKVDDPDSKSLISREQQCVARTNDPFTLYIENFKFFTTELHDSLSKSH